MLVACLTKLQSAVGVACREAGSLCRRLGWLEEMWHFVQQWGGRGRAASLSPEEFQVSLIPPRFISVGNHVGSSAIWE